MPRMSPPKSRARDKETDKFCEVPTANFPISAVRSYPQEMYIPKFGCHKPNESGYLSYNL